MQLTDKEKLLAMSAALRCVVITLEQQDGPLAPDLAYALAVARDALQLSPFTGKVSK